MTVRWSNVASANGSDSADASTSSTRVAEPPPRSREHLRALVDPGDAEPAAEELGGDEARFPSRRRARGRRRAEGARRGIAARAGPGRTTARRRRGRTRGRAARTAPWRRPTACRLLWATWRWPTSSSAPRTLAAAHDRRRRQSSPASSRPSRSRGGASTSARSTAPTGRARWLGVRRGRLGRRRVGPELRAAVSIAALCEVAVDSAGGGDLDALIASLADLREREAPEGIEDAEAAARALREVVGEPPQLATPARLDAIGAATRAPRAGARPGRRLSVRGRAQVGPGRGVRAPARGRGRLPGRPHVTWRRWKARRLLPVRRRRSRGSPRRAARVRGEAGRVRAGRPARAVRDAHAEHRGRPHGRGARPDPGRRPVRRAGDSRSATRCACSSPRRWRSSRQPVRASCTRADRRQEAPASVDDDASGRGSCPRRASRGT